MIKLIYVVLATAIKRRYEEIRNKQNCPYWKTKLNYMTVSTLL